MFKLVGCFFVLAWALGFGSFAGAAEPPRGTGAVLNSAVYGQQPRGAPLTRGDYSDLPASVSLEDAAPTPGDQGQQGSCVGWAVAYAARTIAEAKVQQLSPKQVIDRHVFSPSYVYNQIVDGDCDTGSMIHHALRLVERRGVPLLRDFPYDDSTCSQPVRLRHDDLASDYRIDGWRALTPPDARSGHVPVRRALAMEHPVVIGMLLPDSFFDTRSIVREKGLWMPLGQEYRTLNANPGAFYGHAMTVIGYDDQRFGGAFRLINSWGTDWGDKGYVWVRYEDFSRFVIQAYEVIPEKPQPQAEPNLGGALKFVHISGEPMSATHQSDLTWRLDRPYPSGTRFRTELTSGYDGHVYIIGGDRTGNYVELFPRDRQTSSMLVSTETMVIPGPTEDFYTRMNESTGTDYYIALFSRGRVDMPALLQRMNGASGTPSERLQRALGARLDKAVGVQHSNNGIGARAHVAENGVLPVIVEVEHVAQSDRHRDRQDPRIILHQPAFDPHEEVATGQRIHRVDSREFTLRGVAQDESAIRGVQVKGSVASRFSSRGPFEARFTIPDDATEAQIDITARDEAGNEARELITVVLDERR